MASAADGRRRRDAGGRLMLPPGSTIGILGGGQLGRMIAGAAARLGYRRHIFTPEARGRAGGHPAELRSEEHTTESQSRQYLVCRLRPVKKKRPLSALARPPHSPVR